MNKPQEAQAPSQQLAVIAPCRLPFHPALESEFGVDRSMWRLLCESVYPSAKTIEGIALAVRYCKTRNLDILKRPVHVVPVWNSKLGKEVELVWPGIAEYRTTATRTGEYAGCDPTEFGPMVEKTFSGSVQKWENGRKAGFEEKEVTLKFPSWARVTVYRILQGKHCAFPGPTVHFEEIYSRLRHDVEVPNDRWQKSPNGQLEKCAEAAALRKAFPEELGQDYTADEMEGKVIDIESVPTVLPKVSAADVAPLVAEHLASVGVPVEAKPDPKPEPPKDPPIDADWQAILDELSPGLETCSTASQFGLFFDENAEMIQTLSTKSPEEVRRKFDGMCAKKVESFRSKK